MLWFLFVVCGVAVPAPPDTPALNGDIVSAVGYNAALLVAAAVLALAWIGWLARSTGRTGPPDLLQMRHSATVTAAAIGTWWVVRLVGIVPAPPLG